MPHLAHTSSSNSAAPQGASVSLVLPAWNEADAIPRAIAEADAALSAIATEYEIIVVDDGSRDGTAERVLEAARTCQAVRLVRHQMNRGYGAALRTGFAAAQFDLVAFTDADNQFDLRELDRFVLLAKQYQIVCGYRIDRKDPPLRLLYSRVYNALVRSLLGTGVRDVDCALKMFHRETIQRLSITTDGFLVNSEILSQARQEGLSVVEVGVTHRPRTEGQSTVSAAHIPAVFAALLRYWWNRVQFCTAPEERGNCEQTDTLRPESRWRLGWAQIALLLFAAGLLLLNLGYPLIDRDETRYAEIPREMLATGDWITPQLNFQPYYDKPPLLYWLCALSYSAFGVSEWSARIVPALGALGTLAATMWFGSRIWGRKTGTGAGIVLLTSVGFLASSRLLLIDGVLTLLITVACFAAFEAIRRSEFRVGWWIVASVACGLAFLTKGPVSLVLLIPPIAIYSWLSSGASEVRLRHWILMGGVVTAVAAPWFAAMSIQDPQFASEFFVKHHIQRFAGAFHERPFWYFIPVFLVAGHPWTFLLAPCATFLFGRDAEARRRRPTSFGFLLIWAAWCFAFFSILRCKLPSYILPCAPPCALLLGHFAAHCMSVGRSPLRDAVRRPWRLQFAMAATCTAGISFCAFGAYARLESPLAAASAGALCVLVILAVYQMVLRRVSVATGWAVCAAMSLLVSSVVLHREAPRFASARTLFGPGSTFIAQAPDAQGLPITTVGHEWSEAPFYLHRNDVTNIKHPAKGDFRRLASGHDEFLVLVRRATELENLSRELHDDFRVDLVADRGRAHLVRVSRASATRDVANLEAARLEVPHRDVARAPSANDSRR